MQWSDQYQILTINLLFLEKLVDQGGWVDDQELDVVVTLGPRFVVGVAFVVLTLGSRDPLFDGWVSVILTYRRLEIAAGNGE
jgi:hypothetical protein